MHFINLEEVLHRDYARKFSFGEEENSCNEAFAKQEIEAGCILYDDHECKSTPLEPLVLLKGQSISLLPTDKFINEAESLSIKKGCQLTVYKGKANFSEK